MLSYTEYPEIKTVELAVDGAVTREEYDAVAKALEVFIATHGKIRVLEIVKGLTGIGKGVLLRDIKFSLRHMKAFSRVALVTDVGWVRRAGALVRPIFRGEFKHFPAHDIEQARAWLARPDGMP